jgi:Tfp pilus assembly protein PilX
VGPAGAQIAPLYLIEHLGSQFACDTTAQAAQTCRQYRITARAGGGQRAEVMLQSLYLTD